MAEISVEKAPLTATLAERAKPEVKEKLTKMKTATGPYTPKQQNHRQPRQSQPRAPTPAPAQTQPQPQPQSQQPRKENKQMTQPQGGWPQPPQPPPQPQQGGWAYPPGYPNPFYWSAAGQMQPQGQQQPWQGQPQQMPMPDMKGMLAFAVAMKFVELVFDKLAEKPPWYRKHKGTVWAGLLTIAGAAGWAIFKGTRPLE